MPTITIIDDGRAAELPAAVAAGRTRVPQVDFARAFGWELKPQGFCKDDLCYPVRDASVVTADGVDIEGFAALLGRPLAYDADENAGYIGVGSDARASQLASLEAPDFTLPDLDGNLHSLSDYRGKKVLLATYGSW